MSHNYEGMRGTGRAEVLAMRTVTKSRWALLAGILLLVSCEKDSSVNPGDSFSINPSSSTMGQTPTTIILVTQGGHQPTSWTVSNPALGSISGNGTQVTYTRTASNGINTVTCTDEAGWTATATIKQQNDTPPMATLTVSPTSATLTHDDDEVAFTAAGGSGGYRWYSGDTDEGEVRVLDNTQAVYRRKMQGDNTVELQDSEGHVAIATVVQPPLPILAVSPTSGSVSSTNGTETFRASGGTQSYQWQMVTAGGAHGEVSPLAGATTLYTSTEPGQDTIQLSDGVSVVFITVTKH